MSHIINLNQIGSSVCWNGDDIHCNEIIVGLEDGNLKIYDIRNCGEVLTTFSLNPVRIRKIITIESMSNTLLCGMEVNSIIPPKSYIFTNSTFIELNLFVSFNMQDSSVAALRRGNMGEYEMIKSINDRHEDYVTDLLYLQQTSQLVTCSWDKTVKIGVFDIAPIL